MNDGAQHAWQFFGAYFHQDCLVDDPDWGSIVQRFRITASHEAVHLTREELAGLLAASSDASLEAFLYGSPHLCFYDPRPEGLTVRAWLEAIVHVLAGGSPPAQSSAVSRARRQAVRIAREVIAGTRDVLLAARDLSSLQSAVDVPDDDPDFTCFSAIASETDHLPLGSVRSLWAPVALHDKDVEIARSKEWALTFGKRALESVVLRFGGAG